MSSLLLLLAVAGCANVVALDRRQATATTTVTLTSSTSSVPQYFQTTPELFASPSYPPQSYQHHELSRVRCHRDRCSAISPRDKPRAFRGRKFIRTQLAATDSYTDSWEYKR
jgi:hypothetical protein